MGPRHCVGTQLSMGKGFVGVVLPRVSVVVRRNMVGSQGMVVEVVPIDKGVGVGSLLGFE